MPNPPTRLSQFDLDVLTERGIPAQAARRNRLSTDEKLGAMVIPFADLNGVYNCFQVLRPHNPKPGKDGKPLKYIAPAGKSSRLYIPAESRHQLLDVSIPFVLTEGMLKAIAMALHGHASAGLLGVWNWKVKDTDELIPDLAAIPLAGREVRIVFDYDPKPATRHHVDLARRRLAQALRKVGAAEVYNVELPPGPDWGKQGVDDFIVAHGADAFGKLLENAQPVPPMNAYAALSKMEGRTDTANAARLVAKYGDVLRWVGPWDKFLIWDGTRWRLDQSLAIESKAKDVAAGLFAEITGHLRGSDDDR